MTRGTTYAQNSANRTLSSSHRCHNERNAVETNLYILSAHDRLDFDSLNGEVSVIAQSLLASARYLSTSDILSESRLTGRANQNTALEPLYAESGTMYCRLETMILCKIKVCPPRKGVREQHANSDNENTSRPTRLSTRTLLE